MSLSYVLSDGLAYLKGLYMWDDAIVNDKSSCFLENFEVLYETLTEFLTRVLGLYI
jgi:hypothetical protein